MLDLMAGILAGGCTTHQIPPEPDKESRLSQVFIAFDPARLGGTVSADAVAEEVIRHFQDSSKDEDARPRYPGERVVQTRLENMEKGVPVEPSIWRQVQDLAS